VPIRDLPTFDRPRERLVRAGAEVLTDVELLAVVIGAGTRGMDVAVVAASLLAQFGELRRVAAAGVAELASVRGVGHVKACRLKAALALAGRLVDRPYDRGEPIRHALEVYERIGRRVMHLDHEVFLALALDTQGRVITELSLAQGGACSVDFRPADVFRALLRAGASATILVHNHPSGEPEPSETDVTATERLARAGDLLGIRLLDHVIVARGGFRSCMPGKEEPDRASE